MNVHGERLTASIPKDGQGVIKLGIEKCEFIAKLAQWLALKQPLEFLL